MAIALKRSARGIGTWCSITQLTSVALRAPNIPTAARQLQVFNLEQKAKITSHLMTEDMVFWKWISPSLLGLVTETAVYHWDISAGESAVPVKQFDRHANLTGSQIINYRVNAEGKWMLLVGISAQVCQPAQFLPLVVYPS
jgi:hypothetical protein